MIGGLLSEIQIDRNVGLCFYSCEVKVYRPRIDETYKVKFKLNIKNDA